MSADRSPKGSALFLQLTNPALFPPIIHASQLMAEAGWDVTLLSAPVRGKALAMPQGSGMALVSIAERPSHVISPQAYARYLLDTARLALRLRPAVVYASDPFSAGPALMAQRLTGARLVYHEHDTPAPGALRPWVARLRQTATRGAAVVVLPNEARAELVARELGVGAKTVTVWNLPLRRELPAIRSAQRSPLLVYYHGNISPDLVPPAIVDALRMLKGKARLRLLGYEAPGAGGYLAHLQASADTGAGEPMIEYLGRAPRDEILARAAGAHVGLALAPPDASDLNLRHLVGASNKAFDYLAAGQALLVSDLPEWRQTFVCAGYARACDRGDPADIAAALGWFIDHPEETRAMGASGRARIEADWNYETAFAPVLARLSQ